MSREPRVHWPPGVTAGADTLLQGGAARHLQKVLRLGPGSGFRLFDGAGHEWAMQVVSGGGDGLVARATAPVEVLPEPSLGLRLLQGICRGEPMDLVIQKAVELGIAGIQPVETRRTVVRLSAARAARRLEHWRRVAASACEQCGRATVPGVGVPLDLAAALAAWPAGDGWTGLYLDPAGELTLDGLAPPAAGFALLVGPEGGLDEDERARVRRAGYLGLRLGPRILRTETAALVALAALQALWGDLTPAAARPAGVPAPPGRGPADTR